MPRKNVATGNVEFALRNSRTLPNTLLVRTKLKKESRQTVLHPWRYECHQIRVVIHADGSNKGKDVIVS